MVIRFLLASVLMALFISCGSDEPPSNFCDFVVCQNGGTCNGESCDCPLGFMGIDCAVQMEPVAIEVKDIVLSQFSATDINGDTWDDDPEEWFPAFADNEWPDIYVVVSNQTGIIYNKTNPNVLNVENDQMTTLELFNPIVLTDIYLEHKISIMDFDKNGISQLIDQITFKPYENGNGFPTEIVIENAESKLMMSCNYMF